MKTFYFTYGTDGQPFFGGWTEVRAANFQMACDIFKAFHPLRNGLLTCCSVYTEEQFKKTVMYSEGNFGHRAWETITVSVEYAKE